MRELVIVVEGQRCRGCDGALHPIGEDVPSGWT